MSEPSYPTVEVNRDREEGPPAQPNRHEDTVPSASNTETASPDALQIPPRDAEQIRRARVLLKLAAATDQFDDRFVLSMGALHLARSVPEYWFTTAQQIPAELNKSGEEAKALEKKLRTAFEDIFSEVRRFELLTELRQWDYHWEPVINAATIGPNGSYGRGAPMRLSTGPTPNSSVAYYGGSRDIVATGSGKRLGRKNYYKIEQGRYVDFEKSEAISLRLAITQFLDDLPTAIAKLLLISEVQEYAKKS